MKFVDIIEIPKFIEKYISVNGYMIEKYTHTFCAYLLKTEFEKIIDKSNNIKYMADVNDKTISCCIDFYLDKSELNYYYECKYESEIGVPKSITNEIFKIQLEDGKEVELYIESFKDNKLILAVLK